MNLVWYNTLQKPPFTPPAEYFPIAWTILYILMGIAFIVILFKKRSFDKYIAVLVFIIQLILNIFWSYIFFNLKMINLALFDVMLLLVAVVVCTVYFFKLSKFAGALLIPYLLQVVFALYLNAGFAILN